MKERPILFSGPMVRAILDGGKTQTRRVIKLPSWSTGNWNDFEREPTTGQPIAIMSDSGCFRDVLCPYGYFRDRLWVRETWVGSKRTMRGYFRADSQYWDHSTNTPRPEPGMPEVCKWKPAIFMPRWASRITLEITKVRVERLNLISEMDAKAEGVEASKTVEMKDGSPCYSLPYQILWNQINGVGAWEKNPWVWVIEFRKLNEREEPPRSELKFKVNAI